MKTVNEVLAAASALRGVEAPTDLLSNGVSAASFDPDTLRAAAEAHNRHPFDHDMRVKSWVVLFLLDNCAALNPSASRQGDEPNPARSALTRDVLPPESEQSA